MIMDLWIPVILIIFATILQQVQIKMQDSIIEKLKKDLERIKKKR